MKSDDYLAVILQTDIMADHPHLPHNVSVGGGKRLQI